MFRVEITKSFLFLIFKCLSRDQQKYFILLRMEFLFQQNQLNETNISKINKNIIQINQVSRICRIESQSYVKSERAPKV